MEYILRSVQPQPPKGPKPKRDNRSGKIVSQSPPLPLTEPLPPIGQKPQVRNSYGRNKLDVTSYIKFHGVIANCM